MYIHYNIQSCLYLKDVILQIRVVRVVWGGGGGGRLSVTNDRFSKQYNIKT